LTLVPGVVAWGISAVWIAAASALVWMPLRPGRQSLRLASYLFLLVFVTTASQLVAGLLGLLRPAPLGVLSAAGLVLAWSMPATRSILRTARAELGETGRAGARAWHGFPAWLRVLSLVLIPVLAIRAAFLVWALPPFVWDSLTYHLPNVAAWTQAGRIYAVESPVNRMMSPANFEVFVTWFTTFLHHDLLVEAAGLPAYALGVISVYALGRAIGLAQWSSWIAAIGFATTPALLLASTGTKNDPIMAALFLFILAMGWEMAAHAGKHDSHPHLQEAVLTFLAFCLALGTKAYILQLLAGVIVVVVLVRRSGKAQSALRPWEATQHTWRAWTRWDRGMVIASVLAAVGLACIWYARNWVVTGNPLYPYGVQVGGSALISGSSDSARVTWDDFATNMSSLLDRLGDKRRRISPDLPETTGWGWVAYGLGVPALIWGLVRSRRQRILAVGFAIALVLMVQASPTAVWMTRFLSWVPALLCLSVGEVMQEFDPASRAARWGFVGLLSAACGLNVAMTLNYNTISLDDFRTMLSLPALDRESSAFGETVPDEYAAALEIVPRDTILGYNVHGNGFTYPLYRADYSQRLVYVPIPDGSTCGSVADSIEARGTRYLFVAPEHTEDWILTLLNQCATEKDVLRERVRGLYVVKRQ
jgi:hypothetical protein